MATTASLITVEDGANDTQVTNLRSKEMKI